MKRKYIFILSILMVLVTSCRKNDSKGNLDNQWELIFQDDFNGTSVNLEHWGLYDSQGNTGDGMKHPSSISVNNGLLTISTQMMGDNLVAGGMAHQTNLKYGKFEIRVRTDFDPKSSTSGVVLTWPQSEKWPIDGEIDIYETSDNGNKSFHTFVHYDSDNKQYHKEHLFDPTQWHTVAMEWTPESIRIYINDIFQWELTDQKAIPSVPHHLCIQLETKNKLRTDHIKMQVDWVKVYQMK